MGIGEICERSLLNAPINFYSKNQAKCTNIITRAICITFYLSHYSWTDARIAFPLFVSVWPSTYPILASMPSDRIALSKRSTSRRMESPTDNLSRLLTDSGFSRLWARARGFCRVSVRPVCFSTSRRNSASSFSACLDKRRDSACRALGSLKERP